MKSFYKETLKDSKLNQLTNNRNLCGDITREEIGKLLVLLIRVFTVNVLL